MEKLLHGLERKCRNSVIIVVPSRFHGGYLITCVHNIMAPMHASNVFLYRSQKIHLSKNMLAKIEKEREDKLMKKNIFRLTVLLTILTLLLPGVAPVMAAEKTEFQCEEILVDTPNPGRWTYPNGNIHIRGMVNRYSETSTDPRMYGVNEVILNANWHEDYTGPMWGTFWLENDYGGWEGTWAGLMTVQGPRYNAVGDGFGDYAGMKLWINVHNGVCTGSILEH